MLTALLALAAPGDRCAALAAAGGPQLEISSAVSEGGACRVEAIARPRPDAAIGVSVWLPAPERWSGRYYQMGNGGFAGSIDRATLAAAAARGDAAAATDTGHHGTGFQAGWADGRPDLVRDYAGDSIKAAANAAARLTLQYYGRAAARRYFMGCSFGGRQALVAASRWPADWDGIIAGAPAVRWPDWLLGFAGIQHGLRAVPGGWIPPERIRRLTAIARRGAAPAADALAQACRAGERDACLTPPQAAALRTIERAGYRLADADPAEWRRWMLDPDPAASDQARFAVEAARHLFGRGERWTLADHRAGDRVPPDVAATFAIGSLKPFMRRGGKVIAYVGSADAVLPPRAIIAALRARLPAADGYRLLTVPGMAHCQGGAARNAFGQATAAPSLRDDADHDIRRALESWVERGAAPRTIVAAGAIDAGRPTALLAFTRR